jgi:hypothetical protein
MQTTQEIQRAIFDNSDLRGVTLRDLAAFKTHTISWKLQWVNESSGRTAGWVIFNEEGSSIVGYYRTGDAPIWSCAIKIIEDDVVFADDRQKTLDIAYRFHLVCAEVLNTKLFLQ